MPTYNPNDVVVIQRNSISSSFVERVLVSQPNSYLYFDSESIIKTIPTQSSFVGTTLYTGSTYEITSSWSSNSVSASWAPGSSPGTTLFTGSTYYITTSWADNAISASWAPGSTPGTTLYTGSPYPITSSWSSNAISASWPPFISDSGTTLFTGSTYEITSSWANLAISASWAPGSSPGTTLYTASTYPITSSWSNSSEFAPVIFTNIQVVNGRLLILSNLGGWWELSIFDDGGGNVTTELTETTNTGSYYASSSVIYYQNTASYYYESSSFASSSISSSFSLNSDSASWAPFTDTGTILTTGSTYPITSSWTNNVISSSFASNARSASWAPSSGTTLFTASTYPITSSWSNNTISSSYALDSKTASFALNAGGSGGTTLYTGSTYQITSSWANNTISSSFSTTAHSSSYSPVDLVYSSSVSDQISNKQTSLITGSIIPITSSWATDAISSSFSLNADSASWAPGGSSVYSSYTTLLTGSNNDITASFDSNEHYIDITLGQLYTFTSSNYPPPNQVGNTTIFINNTSATTSSLSFPSDWVFLGVPPTSLSSSRSALLSLKYINGINVAGFAVQY